MTDNHPITPPPELLAQWEDDILDSQDNVDYVLDCAWRNGFQAGADQELEACCKLLELSDYNAREFLTAARRPKPRSLKEQALSEVAGAVAGGNITPERGAIIRLALEALPND